MNELLRKVRGVTGLALTWAVGWAVIGALLTIGLRVARPGDLDVGEHELGMAARFAAAGLVAGAAFAILLAGAERRRAVADLSVSRAALWGALGATALPLLTPMANSLVGLHAPLGGSFAAAALALAKRSRRVATLPGDRRPTGHPAA